MYWDNPQGGTIGRDTTDGNPANINQSFITGIQPAGGVGIAVDGQHIYWTNGSSIERANLDGSDVNPQFVQTGEGAELLAVDALHIYWAVRGGSHIGRANLDGSQPNSQFMSTINPGGPGSSVQGLAVDGSYLYWVDSGPHTQSIGRAKLDGTAVNQSFIETAPDNPTALAVSSQHIYWASPERILGSGGDLGQANVDGSDVSPGVEGPPEQTGIPAELQGLAVDSGDAGDANLYGAVPSGGAIAQMQLPEGTNSPVNPSFITADQSGGPTQVAVSAPVQPNCLRTSITPPAPVGGAVFARPLAPGGSGANVVVIPAGASWTGSGSCVGIAAGAGEVMTHPSSVAVAPGAAVVLRDQFAGLVSAWGAQSTAGGEPAPNLFPGRSDWETTEADVVTPQQLLSSYHGCPDCVLPNNLALSPGQASPGVAYQHDLSGASLIGDTLTGSFAGWNFSDAQLPGATLNGTGVSGANFTAADLRGAQLTSLNEASPPTFTNVRVGSFDGACTVFENTNLVGTGFTPVKSDLLVPGCSNTPLLPGSTAPLDLIYLLTHTDQATIDFANAQFLATAANDAVLAGVDLHGINLAGASFSGFPPDLESTNFNGASLQKTIFQLADLAGAQFQGAVAPGASFQDANLNGASFAGATTNLQNADFIQADVSGASFQAADISNAVFNRVLAVGTDFSAVIANNTGFAGAHIYGDGRAFGGARQLTGADFVGAVLAGSEDGAGGFDLTDADLTNAKFDNAQCIACNFTGSTLDGASFSGADLPGAQLLGVTLQNASFFGAWLYCGDLSDDSCRTGGGQPQWPLQLGSQETYGPVPYSTTALNSGEWTDVTDCPDGTLPDPTAGCQGDLLPGGSLSVPASCSAVALDACPTPTSTVFNAQTLLAGAPISLVRAVPPTWVTALRGQGYDVGLTDGTVRLVGGGARPQVVAGSHNRHCSNATQPCGDGGPATQALLGTPAGLAVGLDGSLYVADPALHRVRRIDRSGSISTVAGTGQACGGASAACGDGGAATAAALSGPFGVWASPGGALFIADGVRGIREVLPNGNITTIGAGSVSGKVVSVAGDAGGNLYAATNNPDYIIQVDLSTGQVTTDVGTGASGYNGGSTGNQGAFGALPGNQAQIDLPEGLSVDLGGDVLFADAGNDLIRGYDPSTGNMMANLGGLVSTSGNPQGGFNGDGQYADQTTFQNPAAVTATRGALLVVADTGNSRVRQIGPSPLANQSPPPPPLPNNHFKVSHITTHRSGAITFMVKVPGRGTVDVLATAWKNNLARTAVRLRPAPHRFVYGRRHATARRATTLHLRLTPNASGRRLVRHHTYRIVLRLWVSYTPTGGRFRSKGFKGLHLPRMAH